MSSIPIGAAVKDHATATLGRVVPTARIDKMRGFLTVQFEGESEPWAVWAREVRYIARHYEAARDWEAKMGPI